MEGSNLFLWKKASHVLGKGGKKDSSYLPLNSLRIGKGVSYVLLPLSSTGEGEVCGPTEVVFDMFSTYHTFDINVDPVLQNQDLHGREDKRSMTNGQM